MTMSLANLTFDCHDPELVARFWSEVTGLAIDDEANEYFVSIGRADTAVTPKWFFAKVPEPKTTKNRLHIDLESNAPDVDAKRLLELGASKAEDKNEWGHAWTIYRDPEGNEFCMSGPHA